jgi:hypothetical protein
MRFTANDARERINLINATLLRLGHDRHLAIQARNGYYGLDVFRNVGGSCTHTVITGTARLCAEHAQHYLGDVALNFALKGEA